MVPYFVQLVSFWRGQPDFVIDVEVAVSGPSIIPFFLTSRFLLQCLQYALRWCSQRYFRQSIHEVYRQCGFSAIQDSVWSCPRRFVDARSVGQERQWKSQFFLSASAFVLSMFSSFRWNLSTRPLDCG
ncbi:hypothetical protein T4C_6372 [Trichinella pseudospiralis]|uniref:Uncharacterized protein n=1 Tax=Trichinella pseudospiralis TaxID=6337 RepID=A0A0V1JWB3_TRIPS|nr:hypothetical protein T4C_6372 [Trichinella pseudospiralis]